MYKRILQTSRKGWYKHLLLRVMAQYGREAAEKDACVCSYRGLGVHLHLGEDPEEVVIENAVRKLYGFCQRVL